MEYFSSILIRTSFAQSRSGSPSFASSRHIFPYFIFVLPFSRHGDCLPHLFSAAAAAAAESRARYFKYGAKLKRKKITQQKIRSKSLVVIFRECLLSKNCRYSSLFANFTSSLSAVTFRSSLFRFGIRSDGDDGSKRSKWAHALEQLTDIKCQVKYVCI